MTAQTIPVSQFKARCLRLLEDVAAQNRTLIVTKRGRPIVRVVPALPPRSPLRGSWKGSLRIRGDIVQFSVADEWEASQ